jgi:hypothetical protein
MKFVNQITGERIEAAEWQIKLKPGDYFVNERPIAGVIDKSGTQLFDTSMWPTIYVHIDKPTRDAGFFWCTAYSEWEPNGDKGVQCILDATRQITKEEFEAASLRDWKKP